ncbi:MAG: STAS domain-containing protein [Anaerolineales bacterium]
MRLHYIEMKDGLRLIKLVGRLDINGVNQIESTLIGHCNADNLRVAIDLSKVSFLSSIGIPMLINAARLVGRRGGKIAFISPQGNVASVLDVTGISSMVPIHPDLETAQAKTLVESAVSS